MPEDQSCESAAAWQAANGYIIDLCGAPAGQACEPGCPSLADDPADYPMCAHP